MSELEKPLSGKVSGTWRQVRAWLLSSIIALGILGSGVVTIFWAYQVQTYTFRLDLGSEQDKAYLANFEPPETASDLSYTYRWSEAESYINLVYPSSPFELTFRAAAPRPDGVPVDLSVVLNGREVRRFALDEQPREYVLRSRLFNLGPSGLSISFKPHTTFTQATENGPREVGIALDWIEVRQAPSRFGPTIPPPFVLGWWLMVGALPLLLAPLAGQSFQRGLKLAALTFLLIDLLYLVPDTARLLRLEWAQAGATLTLANTAFLLVWAVLGWRQPRRIFFQPRLRLPPGVWLAVGLALLYLATASGRLFYAHELQLMASNINVVKLRLAAPIDLWLPDPPPGQANPQFLERGWGFGLVASPLGWLGQRLARALPFLPSELVSESGLVACLLLTTNLLLGVALALALFWVARSLGYRAPVALGLALVLGVGTAEWRASRTFLSEPLTALCLLLAFGLTLSDRRHRQHRPVIPRRRPPLPALRLLGQPLFLAGLFLGLAVANDPLNLALAPVFAFYIYRGWRQEVGPAPARRSSLAAPPVLPGLPAPNFSALGKSGRELMLVSAVLKPVAAPTFRPGVHPGQPSRLVRLARKWRVRGIGQSYWGGLFLRLSIGAGPLFGWLALLLWHNLATNGSLFGPVSSGPGPGRPIWEKFYLAFFQPGEGLLATSPVLFLALPGLVGLARRQPSALKLIGAISLIYLLINLLRSDQPGPWNSPPAFYGLLPLLGLWLLPVGPVLEDGLNLCHQLLREQGKVSLTLKEYNRSLVPALLGLLVIGLSGAVQIKAIWWQGQLPAFAAEYYHETTLGPPINVIQANAWLWLAVWLGLAGLAGLGQLVKIRSVRPT